MQDVAACHLRGYIPFRDEYKYTLDRKHNCSSHRVDDVITAVPTPAQTRRVKHSLKKRRKTTRIRRKSHCRRRRLFYNTDFVPCAWGNQVSICRRVGTTINTFHRRKRKRGSRRGDDAAPTRVETRPALVIWRAPAWSGTADPALRTHMVFNLPLPCVLNNGSICHNTVSVSYRAQC